MELNGAKILYTIHTDIPLLGDLKITQTLVTTWIVMALLSGLAIWLGSNLKLENVSKRQAAAEFIVVKTVIAVRLFTPEWTAARTNSGTAAQRASSMAIKWVSALPGSRMVMFIVVPPPYIWIQWNAYFAGILCQG